MLSDDITLTTDNKTLFILTQQDEQYDHLSLSFAREPELDDKFNLHLVNLSEQYPQLDVHIAPEGKTFSDAELLDSLSLHEVTAEVKTQELGKYNLYLTLAGQNTPVFTAQSVNFAYENTYVLIIRDKHGALENQLSLDLVLNSSSVTAYNNVDASAQFRLYNSLTQPVMLALDNTQVATVPAGTMSSYVAGSKGDFSLSVRDENGGLLLNSALLSLAAGDSKAVLLYADAQQQVEAFIEGMAHFKMGFSWGGFESLITATMKVQNLRTATTWPYSGPLIRLHIGLEDVEDLLADLDAAFVRFQQAAATAL